MILISIYIILISGYLSAHADSSPANLAYLALASTKIPSPSHCRSASGYSWWVHSSTLHRPLLKPSPPIVGNKRESTKNRTELGSLLHRIPWNTDVFCTCPSSLSLPLSRSFSAPSWISNTKLWLMLVVYYFDISNHRYKYPSKTIGFSYCWR